MTRSARVALSVVVLAILAGVAWASGSFSAVLPSVAAPAASSPTSSAGAPSGDPLALPTGRPGRRLEYPEVSALAKRLGPDPAALLAFVASSIRYEAYAGALRGPRGTLLAKAGNAADQALLLRALLKEAVPEAESRFALARLSPADANRLIDGPPPTPPMSMSRPAEGGADAPSAEFQQVRQRFEAEQKTAAAAAQADARVLTSVFTEKGIALGPALPAAGARNEGPRDHVWLQVLRNGEWIDLDPTLKGTQPGQRPADPARTAVELPEELYHHVGIHVRLEEASTSKLASRYLLRTVWRSADLVGSTITYTHPEGIGIESLFPPSTQPPDGTVQYTPLLVVDDEYGLGKPFELPAPPAPAGLGDGFGGLGSRLGGMLGGGSREAARDSAPPAESRHRPEVTALFLEMQIQAPDGTEQTIERPVFDRIGFAARAAGNPTIAPRVPVPTAFGVHLPLLGVWSIATWTGERTFAPVTPALGLDEDLDAPSFRASLEQFGAFHRSYYGLRSNLLRHVEADAAATTAVTTNVSILAGVVTNEATSNDPLLVLDAVRSRIEVSRTQTPADAIAPQLLWATTRLHAERLLFSAMDAAVPAGEPPLLQRPDVKSVFDAAAGAGAKLLLFRPNDASRVAALSVSAEAKARLRARLEAGQFTVIPERTTAGPVGWWLFDPGTGTFLDEMEDGRHRAARQTSSENKMATGGASQKPAVVKASFLQKVKRGIHRAACVVVLVVAAAAGAAAEPGDVLEPIADAGEAVAAACSRARGDTGPRPRRNPGGQGPPSTSFSSGPETPSPGAIGRGGWDASTLQGRWPPLAKREASD